MDWTRALRSASVTVSETLEPCRETPVNCGKTLRKGAIVQMIPQMTPSPWNGIAERMLAAVAIKIELPPSKHALMCQRKAAIEKHLEREGSELRGKVRLFYQQGSVAIGATIRAKFRFEGFDIDIIVELDWPGLSPQQALDKLFVAMRGDKGSTYYDMTQRQTRCVTVHYADGMHIDLSPSVLLNPNDPRRSYIFHSKPEEDRSKDKRVLTNSFGFALEYNKRCPVDIDFQQEYARRALAADLGYSMVQKDADSVPVPMHSTVVGGKSAVTVALQLLKRNRNIRWANREGRMPASVMLSALSLEAARPGRTIGQNLLAITQHILDRLLEAKMRGALISVENPICAGDCFTDRWPEDHVAQDLFIGDMRLLLSQLAILHDERRSLRERQDVLKQMFGEEVGQAVFDEFADDLSTKIQTGQHAFGAMGGVLAVPASASAKPSVKPSTFYGTTWRPE